jgi:hypothetical protein
LEKSIYERGSPTRQASANGIAMGRITTVDIDTRLCRVKTFLGPQELLDKDLKNVQWVNADGNVDGDESGSIPREGAIGLVFFIEGEPYIFGFIKPLNGAKGAITGKESVTRLVRGDKLISTKSGNYICIRTNGSIEINSRESLKRVFIPTDSRIQEVCRNFNFKTDGGYINWENKGPILLGQQLFTQEFRRDLARSFVVVEERGAVGASTIYRTTMGPGIPGIPGIPAAVYSFSIDVTGKTSLAIGAGVPVMTADISPAGQIDVVSFSDISVTSRLGNILAETDVGDITATAKLGNISVEASAGNISAKALVGNVSVGATLGDIDVKATAGDITMEGSLGKLKLGKGKIGLGGPAAEIVDTVIKLMTQLDTLLTSMQAETHLGNLGYSSSPPLNVASYIAVQVQVNLLKSLLTTVQGGV